MPLVPDGAGNFYGVADNPGSDGVVFKETPTAVPPVYAPPPAPTVTLVAAVPKVVTGSGEIGENYRDFVESRKRERDRQLRDQR